MNVFDVFSKLANSCPGVKRFQFGSEEVNDSAIIDGQDLLRRERSNRERLTKRAIGNGYDDDETEAPSRGSRRLAGFRAARASEDPTSGIELEDQPLAGGLSSVGVREDDEDDLEESRPGRRYPPPGSGGGISGSALAITFS